MRSKPSQYAVPPHLDVVTAAETPAKTAGTTAVRAGARGAPASSAAGAADATLELTAVGGHLAVTVLLPAAAANITTDVGQLVEALDSLGLNSSSSLEGYDVEGTVGRGKGSSQTPTAPATGHALASTTAPAAQRHELAYRLHHQQQICGEHALRLSLWRVQRQQLPQQLREGHHMQRQQPCEREESVEVKEEETKPRVQQQQQQSQQLPTVPVAEAETRNASVGCSSISPSPHFHFLFNIYFLLPCALPTLRLLAATYGPANTHRKRPAAVAAAATTAASAAYGGQRPGPAAGAAGAAVAAKRNEGSKCDLYFFRLSMQCAVRPGEVAAALENEEEKRIRRLSKFRIKCSRCSQLIAELEGASLQLLPSPLWAEASYLYTCEECPSLPPNEPFARPTRGRGFVDNERIKLSSVDVTNILRGPFVPSVDKNDAARAAAVSCSGCGLVLGTAMELASGAAAALGSHCSAGAPCNAKGCRDSQGTACLDVTTREMSSADIAREEASGAASTEVWLLKRRLQLQAFEGAHWGDDLLHMHSDLSYFVRDLNLYSRDADILCFLLLPLSSPAAAERPWEIGALSPPSVCTPAAASASVATDAEAATTATTVPVGKPWVSLSEHEIALEVRILSRECFIVKGSQKDNGKKGCMAMKVLLRRLTGSEIEAEAASRNCEAAHGFSYTGNRRRHLARCSVHLFSVISRLLLQTTDAADRDIKAFLPPPLLEVRQFIGNSVVAYLPVI